MQRTKRIKTLPAKAKRKLSDSIIEGTPESTTAIPVVKGSILEYDKCLNVLYNVPEPPQRKKRRKRRKFKRGKENQI
ncbi:MAG: hypothetical protein MJ252_07415 [archaeon]|nr:hypothetical protein [archaeon]